MKSLRRTVTAPLATLGWAAGLGVLAVGLGVLAALGAASVAAPGSARIAAVAVISVLGVASVTAGLAGARLGRTIDEIVAGSATDGLAGRPLTPPPVPVRELDDLLTALSAMQQRVRVSDELAERHRRNADAASAGMFGLLAGLVAAEEGARGQLSAELHDTVAQSLGIARRLLEQLTAIAPHPAAHSTASSTLDPYTADLQAAAEQVAEAEESLRATMARTRPPALRDGDLAAAVASFCDDLQYRYGLAVTLYWPDAEFPIPLATAVAVYRFFQEALLNVVKHADVDAAEAVLDVDARFVLAVVRDRGVGLPSVPAAAGRGGRHVGLGLLRERARLAGGHVDIASEPGAGTTLTLRLPRPALPVAVEPTATVPRPRRAPASQPSALATTMDSAS